MRKIAIYSIVAAALLLGTACSEQTKEDVKKATQSVSEDAVSAAQKAQQKSSEAMEEAKEKAGKAVEKLRSSSKEVAAAMGEKAEEIKAEAQKMTAETAEKVEKKAAEVKKAMAPQSAAPAKNGAALYAKCAGCHGADGKTKALGKAPAIAGMDAAEAAKLLKEYKEGKRNAFGMGDLMKSQLATFNEAQIEALAAYISSLK